MIWTQSVRLIAPWYSQPEVVLAGQERRHPGGVVLVDEQLDAVDVGEAGHEVLRVAHERHPDVRPVAVEHPGPGADDRLRLLEVAELLHALLGHDGHRERVGQHVGEPGERLLEREPHGVAVHRLDLVHRAEHVGVGVALDLEEPLDRVDDVVGGQLAAVHGRLRVPPHPAPELEDVGRLVGLAPRLREVPLDGERAGLDAGAGPVLEEPTVREGQRHVRLVGHREHRVEVGRIPGPDAEGAASLGRLRAG